MGLLDPLDVRALNDGKDWELLHEFRYVTKSGISIYVPAGFITDFASIPRAAWWLIGSPATGLYRKAAVPHDWIYRTADVNITRKEADNILLEIMVLRGVTLWRRRAIYTAVRLFGGSSYVKRTS